MSTIINQFFSPIVNQMDVWQKQLEAEKDYGWQQSLDQGAGQVKKELAPFAAEINKLLDNDTAKTANEKLISYLAKLPIRSAVNVMASLCSVVSAALYVAVHPRKGMINLVKSTINLLNELTKPEVWSKMGTSSIGMIAAQSLIMGTPLSLIGLIIATALAAGGVTVEAYTAALNAKQGKEMDAVKEKLGAYLMKAPEVVLTGFFSGLLVGAVRRSCSSSNSLKPLKTLQFEKINDVAQYGSPGPWTKLVKIVHNVTLEEAKNIANSDPNINFFFYEKAHMYLEGINKAFKPNDAVFFTGTPDWGSAIGFADGYVKV